MSEALISRLRSEIRSALYEAELKGMASANVGQEPDGSARESLLTLVSELEGPADPGESEEE